MWWKLPRDVIKDVLLPFVCYNRAKGTFMQMGGELEDATASIRYFLDRTAFRRWECFISGCTRAGMLAANLKNSGVDEHMVCTIHKYFDFVSEHFHVERIHCEFNGWGWKIERHDEGLKYVDCHDCR